MAKMHNNPTRAVRGVVEFRFKDDQGFWYDMKYYSYPYSEGSNGAMYHANIFARSIESGMQVLCLDGKYHHGNELMLVRKYKEVADTWKEMS